MNEGLGDGCELLVVAHKAAVFDDPGECALDDPSAAENLKAINAGASAHDLDDNMCFFFGPLHQPTGIATVGKGPFDEGISGAGSLQHRLAAIAILDGGGMDPDRQQASVGVGQDVSLAAFDLLARVVTL